MIRKKKGRNTHQVTWHGDLGLGQVDVAAPQDAPVLEDGVHEAHVVGLGKGHIVAHQHKVGGL
jgi:hypothetical protein